MTKTSTSPSPRGHASRDLSHRDVVEALLTASRALVGIAARSVASIEDDLTWVQHRALVWLAERGPSNVGSLAEALGIHASTATRLCDRLVDKSLIARDNPPDDRREVLVQLTPAGRSVIEVTTTARRRELDRLVSQLDPADRETIVSGMRLFTECAGELPDDAWQLGWVMTSPAHTNEATTTND